MPSVIAACVGVMVIVWLIPVSSGLLRLAWLGTWAGLVGGLTGWFWRSPVLRAVPIAMACVASLPFVFPARPLDREALGKGYLRRLTALEGTPYFWGGEMAHGIDCSGLPRKALRDSLLHQGITSFNGSGTRGFFRHWWFDASAKALGMGYRGYTVPLPNTGTIRTLDTTGMQPGDLAITRDGRHVMVFLGVEQWIQADPAAGKVIIENGRTSPNHWFNAPVTTHRWRELSAGL
jgi:hypothetical protein